MSRLVPKEARMSAMAPSRTIVEQTVVETVDARGSAMDFATGSEVPSDDVSTAVSSSKTVHAPRFEVKTERLTWEKRVFNVYPDRD